MNNSSMRQASAIVPVVMSLAALTILLAHVALYGIERGADEHAAAHIFQLLMVAQVPVVAYFAVRWARRAPAREWPVLAIQLSAWSVTCAAAYLLT